MITCEFENGGKAFLRHVVIDTILVKTGKILLVKRAPHMLQGGKWGVVGGFLERGETTSQAVEREVFEETGWKIKDLTLLQINDNPNRPNEDRQNVTFVYLATATEKTGEPDDESTKQKWFDLSKLPSDQEMAFDHADMIKLYQKYQKENFALPVIG